MAFLEEIRFKARSLSIFRKLLDDQVVHAFIEMIDANESDTASKIDKYSRFTYLLFQSSENFTEYVWQLIAFDENTYIRKCSNKQIISPMLKQTLEHELKTLQTISQLTSQDIKNEIKYDIFLPEWETNAEYDFNKMYKERINNLFSLGYGIYANYTMFTYSKEKIVPVKYPDSVSLSNLTGYERERKKITDNTIAFIENKPAANTLLYGDAGTGKSSTVKAVVNEFSNRGLRMIEVRKADLLKIPDIIEQLADNPLKFILFIDDLSFLNHNEEIGALKAILEGSVSVRTSNVIIYTTSNRRHLINEKFEDREGSDIHRNETIQEQTSLSDRFGLSVLFTKPDKDKYLQIIHSLIKQYKISNVENIDLLAERYAMERGGRSGRTARQFVESLLST
ncbi:ATP-binding protein [Sedimentibacter hydroxybenzoicus DSM 7310]|uniref:ATP-binding protein n=1 Tax=Sedimentibacter hydroxybenzoicus DSM 7310 TaxID=1123245 RepID=A0A974GV59_SEDHY|nr:ATP-binding protein [Sedimentibacter hydroxybenzoicus]NYB72969.1 ATP-binding protein [Sedimentibacter hydroxybenzoicus DSM 7310]